MPNAAPRGTAPTSRPASHPGQYVRDRALTPKGLSVTEAAKLLGISRPGVSNFLNGKVSATPDMATRVERAFGIPAQELLDMQAAYDAAVAKKKGAATTKAYVPPFLAFKANDIEAWATPTVSARVRLSVFLRTLVHSTGLGLTRVDFPGNDDGMRPGWDGQIEATEGTPWIPEGRSGWEFGVNKDIKGKADSDFAKSVAATAPVDRGVTTFIFVTPRRWPGKDAWVAEMRAAAQWKYVRAYDASDLEQWLEQSHAGQAWFANETKQASEGVRSLDRCWADFAEVAEPNLSGSLFKPAIEAARRTVGSRLKAAPDSPTVIAADSAEEALGFLAQLFSDEGGGDDLSSYRDRVLVFDKPGVLPRLSEGKPGFIAVTADRDVEREMGSLATTLHTIVVYPRNAANAEPHVVLEPLNFEAFNAGLEDMGLDRAQVLKYSDESGRSITVLRRRLSKVPAVKTPGWASDPRQAASLVPFLIAGAWDSRRDADQLALSLLANDTPYPVLEKECQRLAALNDPPIWSLGTHRGLISKIDALYAAAGAVTADDLQRFFSLARMVLGEDDPSLDLPEDQRWAASMHGKTREFSPALRDGFSETLVLLAVHGNHLFKARLGIDCEAEAARLVRDLLAPVTTRTFEANDRDLPTYAEAAPDEFLSIIEKDLKSVDPAVMGLMRPANTGVFGGCPRTGLLWALEGLAWNPVTLPHAALLLAKLSEVEINDNWGNKPIGSLQSIFRAWMPQTAATHDQRLEIMKLLAKRHPTVAWQICIQQIDTRSKVGDYSHKPRWRPDGYGFGEPLPTWGPILAFMRAMVEMALEWTSYSREMLCDLIRHLQDLTDKDQARVWKLVEEWSATASDEDKAVVRERIRVSVMSQRAARRATKAKKEGFAALSASAKAAYDALEPTGLLHKHEWLFREAWVEESADELHTEEIDFRKREERIAALRAAALRDVIGAEGLDGVIHLAEMGKSASQIGWLLAREILAEDQLADFILRALPDAKHSDPWARKNLVYGALRSLQDDAKRERILRKLKKKLSAEAFTHVLQLAPFRRSTWLMVDKLEDTHKAAYWRAVVPEVIFDADDESNEAVERLLAAERPRAAFANVRYKSEAIEPMLLQRLLSKVAQGGKEKEGEYQLDQYWVQQAFAQLDKSGEIALEEMARLEFAYIDVLSRRLGDEGGHGVPNLEKYTEANPALFIQAIMWTYKRKDGREDPPEWKAAEADKQHLAERGYKLLESIQRMPGHDDLGVLQTDRLRRWVETVRDTCAELSRLDIADLCLGKLFAEAPVGEDGIWPCEPVRQVMEEIQTESLGSGAHTGLYNARGVHWRGEGGSQERELAERYHRSARALQYSYPFVASIHTSMAKTYEHEASYQDTEAGIRRRMR